MNVVLSTKSLSSDSKTYTFIIVSAFIIRLYFSTSQEVLIELVSNKKLVWTLTLIINIEYQTADVWSTWAGPRFLITEVLSFA